MKNNTYEKEKIMTEFDRMRRLSARNQRLYPPGTRIELLRMVDEPFPVRSGTRGTVVACDDGGNVLMEWDDGRTLALRPDVDRFRVLSQEECEDEQMNPTQDSGGMTLG